MIQVIINMTDEQKKVWDCVVYETPEEYFQRLMESKTDRLTNEFVIEKTKLNPDKATKAEKNAVINALDAQAEHDKRHKA